MGSKRTNPKNGAGFLMKYRQILNDLDSKTSTCPRGLNNLSKKGCLLVVFEEKEGEKYAG